MGDDSHYHRAYQMSLVRDKINGAAYVLTSTKLSTLMTYEELKQLCTALDNALQIFFPPIPCCAPCFLCEIAGRPSNVIGVLNQFNNRVLIPRGAYWEALTETNFESYVAQLRVDPARHQQYLQSVYGANAAYPTMSVPTAAVPAPSYAQVAPGYAVAPQTQPQYVQLKPQPQQPSSSSSSVVVVAGDGSIMVGGVMYAPVPVQPQTSTTTSAAAVVPMSMETR